ncbi:MULTISPECIES: DUF5615 family PIN-like protein [Rhizobium]|uniref:Nuclease of putative toxin-antitoxin system n=1 Tax=Rhizobium binae TaxID=1138190 RepID=A0ABV2MKX1_9HYPH|nr:MULTISPECIES: DUF5615 family PIN-like protein [Rhizobium]NKL49588.1 hypothetical protein [Rhizobium leguminosarum bv. viciae]MBX4937071.1 DUF5615 family PIN-like protein [Rhizobium binae]MBX4943721.1 DUF5615 family PIN-like protein [Rhizobium binae]MBX4979165.1 DUF5615 family PIN-like protein [Rhizobium binae]MBX4995902.1 DUF5615 family PIN-like protein [Rhizobium binae]
MKLLIDECLSPRLVQIAQAAGYVQSTHIVWLGKSGWKDWELKPLIIDGDWTFVTKNSVDFRGPEAAPGSKGQYADVAIHAGLICLNGPSTMDLAMQIELFEEAMQELQADDDLVNQVLEVTMTEDDIHILRYVLPAE